ncbi:MAG TPA: protein-L-isoaspartate(D-aspartate) O-methyltransferase [Ottowia sp.]|uniref:protein-L-isoaspartate(D-aspartate) O-methyltransferase n=1 Tax=Ottowia sp. TaxID=1898956 RepID=UPI002CCD8137|nr:protein-L-isoaspartate(D-aspartate) O-methyltransferase [Ottowia sp.]HMN22327.1 protein-L-isoaspartate(D-aspartate) O-methyltransferase [Ottowia sp.]
MAGPPQRPGFPARLDLGPGNRAPARPAAPPQPAPAPPAGAAGARDPIPGRARMVQQLRAEGIQDPEVLRAMGSVERHRFVDSALVPQAYEDTALPIGLGQTISKPSVVARMVELLVQGGLRGADGRLGRVLDIGTGCGYQALVLAQLASEVYSIERLRQLHEKARANLRPLRVPNVHLILGDGMEGFARGAPYAAIVSAAGGEALPDAWIDQLAWGGRIVAPIAHAAGGAQALMVVDKTRQGIRQTVLETVQFVPLKSGIA